MSAKTKFPRVVRSGSAVVKTYRSRAGRPGEHFEVRYYSEGKLCRSYRSSLEEARAEARLAADKLAAGELEVLKLVGQDRQEYLAARTNLQPTGISVVLATNIIHNSDYQSVEECKSAIDRYFEEPNQHFKEHPMRAGKKIWGEERVPAVFNESNNCKNPRYQNRTH